MAATDRITGSNVVVQWLKTGDSAGSELTLSADFTEISYNRQTDVADVTAGNETARTEIPTIEGLDFTITMFDAIMSNKAKIQPRTTGTLTIYPTGIGAGKEILQFTAVIKGYNETFPFDNAAQIEITGSRQGAMIKDVGTVQ